VSIPETELSGKDERAAVGFAGSWLASQLAGARTRKKGADPRQLLLHRSAATAVVAGGSPAPTGFLGGDYSVESSSVSLAGTGQALATQATISSTGTLSDMFVYQATGISGSPTIEAAVYANNNGYPGAQIGDSATNALTSAGWLDMGGLQAGSAGSIAVTAGQKVWLIIHLQGSSTLNVAEKGGCSGQGWKLTNSPTWLDDPWTSGATATSDCSVSAYVTG
jgi:hypothetical protein